MKTITTQFFLETNRDNKWIKISTGADSKKMALHQFTHVCTELPDQKFRVVQKEMISEVIAESNDERQATFKFN